MMKTQLLVYRLRDCGFTETNDLTIIELRSKVVTAG